MFILCKIFIFRISVHIQWPSPTLKWHQRETKKTIIIKKEDTYKTPKIYPQYHSLQSLITDSTVLLLTYDPTEDHNNIARLGQREQLEVRKVAKKAVKVQER